MKITKLFNSSLYVYIIFISIICIMWYILSFTQIIIPFITGLIICICLNEIIKGVGIFNPDKIITIFCVIVICIILCVFGPVHSDEQDINNYEITKTKYRTIIETETRYKVINDQYVYIIDNEKIKPVLKNLYSSFNLNVQTYLDYEIKD